MQPTVQGLSGGGSGILTGQTFYGGTARYKGSPYDYPSLSKFLNVHDLHMCAKNTTFVIRNT